MSFPIGAFSYETTDAPAGYVCGDCGASGVKLWREYNTFLDRMTLTCMACSCKREKRMFPVNLSVNNQIGWRIPAVPTEDGTACWGLTSVPQDGAAWWWRLPGAST